LKTVLAQTKITKFLKIEKLNVMLNFYRK